MAKTRGIAVAVAVLTVLLGPIGILQAIAADRCSTDHCKRPRTAQMDLRCCGLAVPDVDPLVGKAPAQAHAASPAVRAAVVAAPVGAPPVTMRSAAAEALSPAVLLRLGRLRI